MRAWIFHQKPLLSVPKLAYRRRWTIASLIRTGSKTFSLIIPSHIKTKHGAFDMKRGLIGLGWVPTHEDSENDEKMIFISTCLHWLPRSGSWAPFAIPDTNGKYLVSTSNDGIWFFIYRDYVIKCYSSLFLQKIIGSLKSKILVTKLCGTNLFALHAIFLGKLKRNKLFNEQGRDIRAAIEYLVAIR